MARKRSEGKPISMEEARESRLVALFNTLLNPLFGSLWWIHEPIWQEALLPQGYDVQSTRNDHPGLSLREDEQIPHLAVMVPMLHGTSNPHQRAFQVCDLTRNHPKPTYFGHFRSVLLPLPLFKDWQQVRINQDKPRLSATEQQALRAYIDQTGMMQ